MDPRVQPQLRALELNTRLLRNCLAGVDDDLARRRPNEHTNNLTFLALHLIDARYYLERYLGGQAESPFKEQLDPIRSIDELESYPLITDIMAGWEETEALLVVRLEAIPSAELDAASTATFPVDDSTRLGGLTFLVQHESYHIGQMAILRRILGLPAMRYA